MVRSYFQGLLPWTIPLMFCQLIRPALAASSSADVDWNAYERGDLGMFPQVKYFSTRSISSPLIHVARDNEECDSSSHTLLTPHGEGVLGNKALIVDRKGELVWSHTELGSIHQFSVQSYRGADYLTFWVGALDTPGHGHGYYKMLDQTYTLAYTISALNGLDGDYHEFHITKDNTAILTSYVKTRWNLKSFGIKNGGYIWDCVFQEIDIEKDSLLFEWRASQHFTFDQMAVNSWDVGVGSSTNPWDWFHLNSVDKDSRGNYLIAARYSNAISYISGNTGEVLWNIGGNLNNFTDLSYGRATNFVDPHSVQWTDSYSAIAVFDNVAHNTVGKPTSEKFSNGLKIHIDEHRKSARVQTTFAHPEKFFGLSGGSIQELSNGNYFVGYGSLPVYAEFSSNGTLLCDAHYSPLHASKENFESGMGYLRNNRIYKSPWVGHPKAVPDVGFMGSKLYVSWNGATELRSWKIEGRGSHGNHAYQWAQIGKAKKAGFETSIELGASMDLYSAYKLTALGESGRPLRSWIVDAESRVMEIERDSAPSFEPGGSPGLLLILVAAVLLLYLNRRQIPELRLFHKRVPALARLQYKFRQVPGYKQMHDWNHRRSPWPKETNPFDTYASTTGHDNISEPH